MQPILDAIARKDAETAVRLARQAVADAPDDAEAHHALGLALQRAGDLSAAAAALDRAIELAPDRARLHVARAALAMGQRDGAQAEALLKKAQQTDPNQLSAYILAAHLALARGQADEAERQLRLAQRVAPEHPVVVATEGNLAQLRGEHERAIRLLSAAVEKMPDEPLILASLGLAFLDAGHLAFAEQALRRALEVQPDAIRLRWARIEALRRQGQAAELPAELERILARQPEDARALALLGDAHLQLGQSEAAVAAYRRLLSLRPLPQPALDGVLRVLGQAGLSAQAAALLDEQIERDPQAEALWQRRVMLVAAEPEAAEEVLERWAAAQPDSLARIQYRAEFEEARGRHAEAEAAVDRVLAERPGASMAAAVKFRLLLRRDPEAALAMAEDYHGRAGSEPARRLTRSWQGFALDRLQRHDEAGRVWLELAEKLGVDAALPPHRQQPADPAASGLPTARLLWGPPGSRVVEVVEMLRSVPGLHLLDDRFGPGPRQDGFWPWLGEGRAMPGARWYAELQLHGLAPEAVVDWLPHWDHSIDTALPEARLAVVLADPRDLLLNALVFGGPQPWPAARPAELAAWLGEALAPLASRTAERLLLVRAEELCDDPGAVAERLRDFFALPASPTLLDPSPLRQGVSGFPTCFPPGHWRRYHGAMGELFDTLAPLARTLGFRD
ncbi:MAG: hypothetical protein KatS3mg126_0823 [Lysobacteraceae bacterium]|nr:MAG: hypothetical protein KatS3mg126_0823 [Xanthomonadaceae bacterium]